MTGVKLYDELAGMAECVPLQRKHFNDEKGERCTSVKCQIKVGLIIQFQFSMQLFSVGYGIRIRIGKAKVVLKKRKNLRNFMFEVFSVWLESSPGAWMYSMTDFYATREASSSPQRTGET
jgi:hypothetical protein